MTKYKALLGLVVFILAAESVLTGIIPHTRGYLFELLGAKSGPIYLAIAVYFSNYLFLDFFQAIKAYFVLKLSLRFRTKRTEDVVEDIEEDIENTPQRIQEDIKLSYHSRITVWCEYAISAIIVVQLLIINVSEPLLIIAALVYSALSVFIAMRFNPKLTRVEKEVQKKEASFRGGLANTLSLGLLPGTNDACITAGKVRMHYLLFTKLQLGLISVLPYIVLVPALLADEINLGTLMKHQASFALIVVNAAILIQYYTLLIQGKASEERVQDLEK